MKRALSESVFRYDQITESGDSESGDSESGDS